MAARSGSDATSNDLRILVASIAVSVSSFLPVYLAGALTVQIAAGLARGYETVAVGVTIALSIGGLSAVFAGRLTDRYGWKPVASSALILSATSLLAIAGSASSSARFIASVGFSGFGLALAQPATMVALLDRSSSQNRGAVFGLKTASSPAATLIAGLSVPLVVLVIDWPTAFAGAVLFPLLAALALWRAHEVRRSQPGTAASAVAEVVADARRPQPPNSRSGPEKASWLPLRLSVGGALAAISIGALSTFTTATVVAAGYSEILAGYVVVGASFFNILARIANGIVLDRPPRHAAAALQLMCALLFVGATGFVLMGIGTRGLVVIGAMMAFFGAWSWNGVFQYSIVTAFRQSPGRASGTVEMGLNLGFASGPVVFLALSERTGFPGAWYFMALLALVSSAQILSVSRRFRAMGLGHV